MLQKFILGIQLQKSPNPTNSLEMDNAYIALDMGNVSHASILQPFFLKRMIQPI